jgi:hypothetical protein
MNKICKRCNIEKERSNFSKTIASKDGLNSWCKECKREYSKERLKNTIVEVTGTKNCSKCLVEKDVSEFSKCSTWCKGCHNLYNKGNYEENKERLKPIRKKWMDENKDKFKLYLKERYVKIDKERLKNYYEENKNDIKIRKEKYGKTDEYKKWLSEYKIKKSWKNRYRDVLKGVIRRIGCKKENKTISILGYSALDFKNHIESKFENNMNWEGGRNEFHIDHIVPVSAFEKDTPLNIINSLDNLRPVSVAFNLQKSNKIDYDEIDIYIKYLEFIKEDYFNDIKEYLNYLHNIKL